MINCGEASYYIHNWKVTSKPWMMCGSMVVGLDGYSGAFDVSCLEKIR